MNKLLHTGLALFAAIFLASPAPAAQRRRAAPGKSVPTNAQQKGQQTNTEAKPAPSPQPSPQPTPAPSPLPQQAPAPEPFDGASVESMAAQCVTLETEAGAIDLKMMPEAAPETVRNFLNLAATGALDTTTFSRVVRDFVIQGGNLSTRETMTPALAARSRRTIKDEPSSLKHERGVVSMARPEEPNAATTNFFILVNNAAHLDGSFSAFALVMKGMEVADAINRAEVVGEKPVAPVRLRRAVVAACPPKPADEH